MVRRMRVPLAVVAALLEIGAVARAEEAAGQKGPLSPDAALASIRVPKGLGVSLFAAEPMVTDPVAMAFDENGVAYVAEMGDYPLGPPGGRIKVLADTDGDGRADRVTLFADGLPYPNGVMPWKGGVLVTAAPDIVFLKDTDGDGKADVREVIFTGFEEGNQQHRVNGLVLGIDNWIYGASGGGGGKVRRAGGNGAVVDVGGSDFRFRPDHTGFELVAGRSQYATTFDDRGNRFNNDNANHIRHAVLPRRHAFRNPHLSLGSLEEMISDHGGAAEVFPSSEIVERPNHVHMAGHFTSACSVSIYRGDALPREYYGNAFVAEPVHNLVHRDVLIDKGPTFTASRAYPASEFLSSTDNWFRPVNFSVGPDGALYVVDMYRAVIEHPEWIPLEMQKRVDLRAGADRGRIYRVAPPGWRPLSRSRTPKLAGAPSTVLVGYLAHRNAWWRMTAQRLLLDRQDRKAIAPLRAATRTVSEVGRAHALWTLDALGALDDTLITRALGEPGSLVHEAALQLAEPRLVKNAKAPTATGAKLTDAVLRASNDPSPRVRFQAALTLGATGEGQQAEKRVEERVIDALARIAMRDGHDRWMRAAALSSIMGRAPRLLARIRALDSSYLERFSGGAPALLRQLAELVGASRDEDQVVAWLRIIAEGAGPGTPQPWRLTALTALGPSLRRWGVGIERLSHNAGTTTVLGSWRPHLVTLAQDKKRETPDRVGALGLLTGGPSRDMAPIFETLLRPQEPSEVQVAAVQALAAMPGGVFATGFLAGWPRYTTAIRREALTSLLSRDGDAAQVLDAVDKGRIGAMEIDPPQREALSKHPTLGARARKLFGKRAASQIDGIVADVGRKVLRLTGDRLRGEEAYKATCAICHVWHAQGYDVGPSLESVAGRDKEALLTDILNPNRALDPKFQIYVVKTPMQEMSGIVSAESPSSITLRAAMGVETVIARRDIIDMKTWPLSMMPEGMENTLTLQSLADLLEFLGGRNGGPDRK